MDNRWKFWPQIVFPDIYVYLVETPSPDTQASLKAFKSMDVYSYYVAGFVSDIISTKADKNCIIVRAKVACFLSFHYYCIRCCLFCSATSVTFF